MTMTLTYDEVEEIGARYGTPFYVFHEQAFRNNYDEIVRAFSSRYDKFILAYSYKTNYIPYLCKIIESKGGFAEVVSRLEYDLALKVGQEPKKIVFNGPVKDYTDVEFALNNQTIVNLDSWYEIDYVRKYATNNPGRIAKVGLRINVDLTDDAGASHLQEGIRTGRFGFSPEGDNIAKVVSELTKADNVVINCLHGHSSTRDRSVWCYEKIARTLCDVGSQHAPETVEYIDIGGGIFGYIPPQMRRTQTPGFDDYAMAVCSALTDNPWIKRRRPYLVLEPGVAMVANTISYVTKVVSVKTIRGQVFVTVDGSAFHTKPTFHKINNPDSVISKAGRDRRGVYNVVGATCMEKDYLLTDVEGALPQQDDYIKIDSVGAYTIVLSPPFINGAPPILVGQGGQYKQIRRKQNLMDMFGCFTFD